MLSELCGMCEAGLDVLFLWLNREGNCVSIPAKSFYRDLPNVIQNRILHKLLARHPLEDISSQRNSDRKDYYTEMEVYKLKLKYFSHPLKSKDE